ncbi:hypothetical protein PREVCOP_04821 [Segatella copri DSM 18205]|uniref:Uncharacterized protein n=1 Tax=Segatella copri DSM 18205 TaxID=537011 RepID=D1PC88_9BACT|nr:hypothetical protein PREVCOP_04821 [Segatella copri DSM 18205]
MTFVSHHYFNFCFFHFFSSILKCFCFNILSLYIIRCMFCIKKQLPYTYLW